MFLRKLDSNKPQENPESFHPVKDEASFQYELAKFFLKNGQSRYLYHPPFIIHAKFFAKENNHRLLVIGPGIGESSLKYVELARELAGEGFDFMVLDHRGQGLSSHPRLNSSANHIEKFESYTDDLISLVKDLQLQKSYNTCIFLGQDVGCLIGLDAMLKEDHLFDGAIFSAPTFKLNMGIIPETIMLIFLKVLQCLGFGERPFQNKYCRLGKLFENNSATGCHRRLLLHRYFEKLYPQVRFHPPSIKWFYEVIKNSRKMFGQIKNLRMPILVMQAGRDRLSCPEFQERFSGTVQNSRLIRLKEGHHEIFQEVDFIRGRAVVQLRKFLREIRGIEEHARPEIKALNPIRKSA